jgi:hypothetical protein
MITRGLSQSFTLFSHSWFGFKSESERFESLGTLIGWRVGGFDWGRGLIDGSSIDRDLNYGSLTYSSLTYSSLIYISLIYDSLAYSSLIYHSLTCKSLIYND